MPIADSTCFSRSSMGSSSSVTVATSSSSLSRLVASPPLSKPSSAASWRVVRPARGGNRMLVKISHGLGHYVSVLCVCVWECVCVLVCVWVGVWVCVWVCVGVCGCVGVCVCLCVCFSPWWAIFTLLNLIQIIVVYVYVLGLTGTSASSPLWLSVSLLA